MADYVAKLRSDLVEQFRGKEKIDALIEILGEELQEVFDFYEELRTQRNVYTAVGQQLDGVGDIAVLTRKEAGELAGNPIPFDVMDDETYRKYLIYKILKNTCDCTYSDIIKAFRMFWDKPLYYREDPNEPATMIFDTGEMPGTVDTSPLFATPLLRAAGVTLKLYARTKTPMDPYRMYLAAGLGYAVTSSLLPPVERDYDFRGKVGMTSAYTRHTCDTLPSVERDYHFGFKLKVGNGFSSVNQSAITAPEKQKAVDAVYSVTETPLGNIQ